MNENLLKGYNNTNLIWDEMFDSADIRPAYKNFVSAIEDLSTEQMNHKDELAKKLFHEPGHHFHGLQQWGRH